MIVREDRLIKREGGEKVKREREERDIEEERDNFRREEEEVRGGRKLSASIIYATRDAVNGACCSAKSRNFTSACRRLDQPSLLAECDERKRFAVARARKRDGNVLGSALLAARVGERERGEGRERERDRQKGRQSEPERKTEKETYRVCGGRKRKRCGVKRTRRGLTPYRRAFRP